MKRPRFGLKLIFLITAFVAVYIAWRQAVERNEQTNRQIQAIPLQQKLENLEAHRAEVEQRLKAAGLPMTTQFMRHGSHLETLDSIDNDIKTLKREITHLTQ